MPPTKRKLKIVAKTAEPKAKPKRKLKIVQKKPTEAELRELTQPTKKGTIWKKEYDKLEGKKRKDFEGIAKKLSTEFEKKYGYNPGIRLIKSMTPERQRRYIAQHVAKETSGYNEIAEKNRE